MKRLSILFAVLIATVASSCKKIEVDQNAINYPYVQSGILLYNISDTANKYAMDGVSVAIRFGVLLDELAKEGFTLKEGETDKFETTTDDNDTEFTPSWDDVPTFSDAEYDIRKFLIGDTRYTKITRGSGEKSGVYTITYEKKSDLFVGGYFDINYRFGSYVIDTKNVRLGETTIDNSWKISTIADEEVELGKSTSKEGDAICKGYSSNLYHAGNGCISFDLNTTFNSGEKDAEDANWGIFDENATLTFKGYDNGFALEDIMEKNIEFTFFGGGDTMGGDTIDYKTIEPVVFNYSKTIYGEIDGVVKSTIAAKDDFKGAEVQVSFDFTEGYVFNYTYLFNGYTYIDSFYYN